MNFRTIPSVLFAGFVVLAGAAPAMAGAKAINRYTTGTEVGTRDVQVENVVNVHGSQVNTSEALKFETNFPTASGGVYYNGSGLTGGLTVSTQIVDPFVEGVYTNQVETLSFTDLTNVNVQENVNFTNDIYVHEIEADTN